MKELITRALSAADADYAEVRLHRGLATRVSYSGQELEDIGEVAGLGGSVRALLDGGWGFVSFNDIDRLPDYVRRACDQARQVGGGKDRLAHAPSVGADAQTKATPEIDPRDISLAEKHDLCRHYNERLLAGSDKIATTNVLYRDRRGVTCFGNTEGTVIEQETCFCGIYLAAVAREGNDVQSGRHSVGDGRGYQIVRGLDEQCDESVRRATDLLAARPVPGGRYDVIMDNRLCGVFAHEAFGHLSEADSIYENPRLREVMRIGRRFGTETLSIVDDATLPDEAGSYAYDSEGVPGRRNELLTRGVLAGRLHSRETAAQMDEEPTGNARAISHSHPPIVRMSNTLVLPGDREPDEIIAETKRGIYALGFLGGQTNIEMFTFTPEEAWLVENGKLTRKLRDMTLTGNVFETLEHIDAVGNDLKVYGGLGGCGKGGQSPLPVGDGGPHIRVKNLVVGSRG